MACKVRSVRLSAILDTINNLVREDDAIETLKDVKSWFAKNFPQIEEYEIVDALISISPKRTKKVNAALVSRKRELTRQAKIVDQLEDFINGVVTIKPKKKIPPATESQKMGKLIRDLIATVHATGNLNNAEFMTLMTGIHKLNKYYADIYGGPADLSAEAISSIITTIKELQVTLKRNRLDDSIKKIEDKIKDVEQGFVDPDDIFTGIFDAESPLQFAIDEQILKKEAELSQARLKYEKAVKNATYRAIGKRGILGFTTTGAVRTRTILAKAKGEGWEFLRTMKFMADISAWGVQLAPVIQAEAGRSIIKMGTGVALLPFKPGQSRDNFIEAFESVKFLGKTLKNSVWDVMADTVRNPEPWLKGSKGTVARRMYKEIVTDPLYPLMKKSKLQISQGRSLSSSEEFFTSDLANSIPAVGIIKDFSEDTMVSSLNAYRALLFRRFYLANPLATTEDLAKAAEHINHMSGTANPSQASQGFSYVLSSPRLLWSRLQLIKKIALLPVTAAGFIGRGGKHASLGDEFVAKKMTELITGYAAFITMAALMPGVDFEDDPREKDWGRIMIGDLKVDFTGGIGSISRSFMKMLVSAWGVDWIPYPGEPSPGSKERADKLKAYGGKTPTEVFLTELVGYRLHPGFGAFFRTLTGEDFFGEPYAKNPWLASLKGAAYTLLPIPFETAIEDQDVTLAILNGIGVNSYRVSSGSQTRRMDKYYNRIGEKPSVERPKQLTELEDNNSRSIMYKEYADRYGDLQLDIVEEFGDDVSKEKFETELAIRNDELAREFLEEYGDEINSLPKKKKD